MDVFYLGVAYISTENRDVVVVVDVSEVTDETRPSGWKSAETTPIPTPPRVMAMRNIASRTWLKARPAMW